MQTATDKAADRWARTAAVWTIAAYPALAAYVPRASEILLCWLGLLALGAGFGGAQLRERVVEWLRGFGSPLGVAALLALAWMTASLLWSPGAGVTVRAFQALGLVGIGAAVWPSISTVPFLVFPTLAISAAVGLVLITLEILGNGLVLAPATTGDALFNSAMATIALFVWPGMAGLVLLNRQAVAIFLWVLAAAAIGRSPSGAALTGFAAGTVVFLLALRWPRPTGLLVTGLACAGLLFAPLIAWIGRGLPLDPASSLATRVGYWTMYGSLVEKRPVFGWGFDAGRFLGDPANREAFAPGLAPGLDVFHPHNVALQIWVEFGLIGAIIAVGLIILTGLAARRSAKSVQPFILAGATAIYAEACGSYGLWETWWLASFILVILILARLAREPLTVGEVSHTAPLRSPDTGRLRHLSRVKN